MQRYLPATADVAALTSGAIIAITSGPRRYRPRGTEHTMLHRVIGEHLEAFLRVEAGEAVARVAR